MRQLNLYTAPVFVKSVHRGGSEIGGWQLLNWCICWAYEVVVLLQLVVLLAVLLQLLLQTVVLLQTQPCFRHNLLEGAYSRPHHGRTYCDL